MAGADRWKKKPQQEAAEAEFGPGDLARSLRTYVARPDTVPAAAAVGAPVVLPGLIMVTAVVVGDAVNFLPASAYEELGGAPTVWATARDNLRHVDHLKVVRERAHEDRPDTAVVTVTGNDPFVAARVADLRWLLGQLEGGDQPLGVLVAVPDRSRLLFHVVSGPGVLPVASAMALAAGHWFQAAGEAGISPQVYYVSPDQRGQGIVMPLPDGKIGIDTTGLLAELLYGPPPSGLGLTAD